MCNHKRKLNSEFVRSYNFLFAYIVWLKCAANRLVAELNNDMSPFSKLHHYSNDLYKHICYAFKCNIHLFACISKYRIWYSNFLTFFICNFQLPWRVYFFFSHHHIWPTANIASSGSDNFIFLTRKFVIRPLEICWAIYRRCSFHAHSF